MSDTSSSGSLAHLSIAAPQDLKASGVKRLDVFLKDANNGRYRWHHADGKATVVDGGSVDHALRVAQMVWSDVQVLSVDDGNPH
ncbi:MAG: hypothetical protein VYE77_00265 [Planctomycetota bacterium]|nr:hypothetical protein [Planctomycetota bacterium]